MTLKITMKSIINIIFLTFLLISLQAQAAQRISKSEKASISYMAVLSVYETKCENLSKFGYQMMTAIVSDQESKGRNIYSMDAFQEGLSRISELFRVKSKVAACKEIRSIVKASPLVNQMIN